MTGLFTTCEKCGEPLPSVAPGGERFIDAGGFEYCSATCKWNAQEDREAKRG